MSALGSKLRKLEGGHVTFQCPGCGDRHVLRVEGDQRPRWTFTGTVTRQPLRLLCWPGLATTSPAIRANAGVPGLTKMESHQAFLATSAIRS